MSETTKFRESEVSFENRTPIYRGELDEQSESKKNESAHDCSRTRSQINVIRLRKFECKWERGIKINYLILKL